jgi:hypothetical protein
MDVGGRAAGRSPHLREAVRRLEWGDWRTAGALLHPVQPRVAEPGEELGATLRTITGCQIQQATGDAGLALDSLSAVAERLARARGIRPAYKDGMAVVQLDRAPTGEPPLLWLVTRLAWREQNELLELRARARRAEDNGVADVAVLATVEYLSRVEFDPWTAQKPTHPTEEEFWGYNRHPAEWFARFHDSELRAMSTGLRQLGGRRKGQVSRPVIYDARGYRGLRQRALRVLADLTSPPWRTAAWDAYAVPNRAGAELAWKYAQDWAQYQP